MTTATEHILIVDDEAEITEGLAAALEGPGRVIITCNDIESAQIVLERIPITTIVSDVRLSGPFAFEGLDIVRFVLRQQPEARVLLMSGAATSDLESEAMRRGASGFLRKPFGVDSLERFLEN